MFLLKPFRKSTLKSLKSRIQVIRKIEINSKYLNRVVLVDIILPPNYQQGRQYSTFYMNDGQDFDQLRIDQMLSAHFQSFNHHFIYVGVHCNENRIHEYGTSYVSDYKGRGSKATEHMNFMVKELMPFIQENFKSGKKQSQNYIGGFSLGGLSAFDIAWENPNVFSKVGVFSGAFWWRNTSFEEAKNDGTERILHNKVKAATYKPNLKFWFECGTNDEESDRNNNGIIDAIDDTIDLMHELKVKGYSQSQLKYVEVYDGEHNFNTWKAVMPYFLEWLSTS